LVFMRRPTGVDEQFFTRWSPPMAYVLGVICADGCLVEHANGYHGLNITSQDLNWLRQLKRVLGAEQKIGRKQRAYQLQVRNQPLYASLRRLSLTPRKSLSLQLPPVPVPMFPDFVRGYFDGDGCVFMWREKRWRRAWQLKTTFASGSRVFLQALQARLCQEAHLTLGSLRYGSRVYCLMYTIRDSLRLYDFMYQQSQSRLCLVRKKRRFDRFLTLKSRPS